MSEFVRSVFPVSSNTGWMLMLRAYFDRSELYEPAGVVVVAGLLSSTDQWERFEASWRGVLDSFDIKSFHMADFESRQGLFTDWSDERRISCITQLNNSINKAAMMGLSVMVNTAEYQALGAVKRGDLDPYPFALCATWAIVQSLRYMRDVIKAESPLACVFHGGDEGSPDVLRLAEALRKRLPDFDRQLHSLSFEKATSLAGLQAADLFAYETAKATLRVFTKADSRPPRKSFVHLLTGKPNDYLAFMLTGNQLREWFSRFEGEGVDVSSSDAV